MLTLASRGPTDPHNIDFDQLRFHYPGPRRQTEEQTLRLLAPGGRLPDRLQATTAAIWTRRLWVADRHSNALIMRRPRRAHTRHPSLEQLSDHEHFLPRTARDSGIRMGA
jgi:hypothetical protein